MAYTVDYQERSGYLYVRVSGERSGPDVVALTREVYEKAIEMGYGKLLIDVREYGGRLKTVESYEVVTREFPKYKGTGLQKAAILDRELTEPNRWYFFETVARNRGFNLGVFADPEAAVTWLAGKRDPKLTGK